jgi:prophage tail gpP-like protein
MLAPNRVPNPDEVATLIVAGHRFDDWETVWVQHRWADAFPLFRFTCAERDPVPQLWAKLQFKPGDECAIYLGGQLAIAGFILQRQVAYDGKNHAVQLTGVGRTWAAARGSILDKTGNFDDMTFEQVARKVIAPFGVGAKTVGTLNAIPFKRLQVEPGETLWNFLERIARPRGIVMGSDHLGNFLLIDHHDYPVVQNLIEGVNILRCQCIISIENTRSDFRVRGQTAASDDQHGTKASEQEAGVPGSLKYYSPLLTPAEQPVWSIGELADRAKNEAVWNEGTIVTATITVQGWLRSAGQLWLAGEKVYVNSPMAMLDMDMKIQTATFTQDRNSGTLTTLDLVAPWLLKDRGDFNVGRAGAPQAPGEGEANTAPPQAAPAADVPASPPQSLRIQF